MTRRRILVLAPAIVVLAAVLAFLLWPSGGGPSVAQASGRLYQVRLTVDDPRLGTGVLTLDVTPSTVDTVTVEPVMPQMGHALSPVGATETAPGRYRAEITFPMVGQWEITVALHGPSGADQVVVPLLVKG
jgi:hypothetical protein